MSIKGLIYIAVAVFLFAITTFGQQTECQQTPERCVLITRDAAIKALQDSDKVKAQESEITVLKQAVADHKDVESNLKVEVAKAIGENTALRQNDVSNRAIIDLLLKNVKKKCILSLCF